MPWVSLDGRLPYEVQVYKDAELVLPADYAAESIVVSIADDGQVTVTAPDPEGVGSWDARVVLESPTYALVRMTEVALSGDETAASKYLGAELEQNVASPTATVEFDAGQWDAVGVFGGFTGVEP